MSVSGLHSVLSESERSGKLEPAGGISTNMTSNSNQIFMEGVKDGK